MSKEFAIRAIAPVRFNQGYIFKTPRIADAQDFLGGAPAVVEAGGVAREAAPATEAIAGFFTAGSEDYAWKEDTFQTVHPAAPIALANQEFRGTLLGTYAESDIGAEYGLVEDASGYWVINKADTVDVVVRVIGVDREAEAGDVNVPVRFVVIEAKRQVIG